MKPKTHKTTEEELRHGWVKCAFAASDAHELNRRMREFIYAYFIEGVLRFGERDGTPWTYREEARALLEIELPKYTRSPLVALAESWEKRIAARNCISWSEADAAKGEQLAECLSEIRDLVPAETETP